MEVYEAFVIAGGCIGGAIGFGVLVSKIVVPALKARDALKRTENIEKNYKDIMSLGGENKAHREEIKAINAQLTSLNSRMGTVETVLNDVADGVVVLLDNKINSSNNDAEQQRALSNLKRHSKVV